MAANVQIAFESSAPPRRFQIGAPGDREGVMQLFSLLLQQADDLAALGSRFDPPFAALVKLANRTRPSLAQLEQFCESRQPGSGWPASFFALPGSAAGESGRSMFFVLLRSALDSAKSFDVDGANVCRALAAVGQTLDAENLDLRRINRELAERCRDAAQERLAPRPIQSAPAPPETAQPETELELPSEVEFRRSREQGGSIRLHDLTLWHASYIGPKFADKSENQDATFAAALDADSPAPAIVFALADGVSTSMGSRPAANSIVRRFCELLLQGRNANEPITFNDLIEAARLTQQALHEIAEALLERPDGYIFDVVRGSSLHSRTAVKILENTLHPRSCAIPAALSATLLAGVAQPTEKAGDYKIDLLRIGDGTVEHIRQNGEVLAILNTDPEVVEIAQALGAGPQQRATFETPGDAVQTRTLTLAPGESLILSSDGLSRGHQERVAGKLSELVGPQFWMMAQPGQPEAALQILHRACRSAEELYESDPEQLLFADNVSLIHIRCGT